MPRTETLPENMPDTGAEKPVILPQILTEAGVLDAMANAVARSVGRGNASARIASELANSIAAPIPWIARAPSSSAYASMTHCTPDSPECRSCAMRGSSSLPLSFLIRLA